MTILIFLTLTILMMDFLPQVKAVEQISNGGFESGTFSGWTSSSSNNSVNSAYPHSGTYSAWVYQNAYIEQTIPGINISSITTFSIWALNINSSGITYRTTYFYSDGTNFTTGDSGVSGWGIVNLLAGTTPPYAPDGTQLKILVKFRFTNTFWLPYTVVFDDISLQASFYTAIVVSNPEIQATFIADGQNRVTPTQFLVNGNASFTITSTFQSAIYQFSGFIINNATYGTSSVTIDNVTSSLNITILYSYALPQQGINLLDIPLRIGLALGISATIGGLLVSIFVLMCILICVTMFTDSLLIIASFLIIGMCGLIGIGWLPYFTLIIIIVMIALMLADKVSNMIAGHGGQTTDK